MDQLDVLTGFVQHSGLTTLVPEVELRSDSFPTPRRRVLVLEDDPLQLQLLTGHLEALGFEVIAAACIAEAQQRLNEAAFQLAIFDVQLPDGSGFELCEKLDNNPTTASLPVIVLSSLTAASAIRRTRASGGRYFLCKPYDPNVLLAIIERVLDE